MREWNVHTGVSAVVTDVSTFGHLVNWCLMVIHRCYTGPVEFQSYFQKVRNSPLQMASPALTTRGVLSWGLTIDSTLQFFHQC